MTVELALQLLTALLNQAGAINALITKAHAEGRQISDAELDALAAGDDAEKVGLTAAIAAARANP